MASAWFFQRNGKQSGPCSSEELKVLARTGNLSPEDSIWKEGMKEWQRAGDAKGLFPTGRTPDSKPPLPLTPPPPPKEAAPPPVPPSIITSAAATPGSAHTQNRRIDPSPKAPGWLLGITDPCPVWGGWLLNGVAWAVFILTGNHFLEFLMGTVCVYVAAVAITKRHERGAMPLIGISVCDAIWMFYWASSSRFDGAIGLLELFDAIRRLEQSGR
jgi:hypothetical protein